MANIIENIMVVDFSSKSSKFLKQRELPPAVSSKMAKAVSQHRREALELQVEAGDFREPGSTNYQIPNGGPSPAGYVRGSLRKQASTSAGSTGSNWRGSGGTARQTPEIYSPLWLNSNLNLPRDRATINAWSRAYFATNGIVHNAISLHSTYPISKLSIKCKNERVEKFFAEMIEEIDLMNICCQIAQEFWILGEAFVYAELDERSAKWSRLLIQNPDYIVVNHSVVAGEPIISLRPDENLKRIVTSNRASDIVQREKLDKSIIEHVKRGENIPLSNFYVSHLARKISPYETRGTGLIVSSFRQLMLFDKLRECYSTDCEILTKDGFKNIWDLVETTNSLDINPNHIVGTEPSEDGKIDKLLTLKKNVKIACLNPDTNQIEYHEPEEFHMSQYSGKMLHFTGKHIDTLVTPNHKMWASEKINGEYQEYKKIKACDLETQKLYKFQATADWKGTTPEFIDVLGNKVPTEVYLKFIGHTISEGCVDSAQRKDGQWRHRTAISQLTESPAYDSIRKNTELFAKSIGKHMCTEIKKRGSGFSKDTPKEAWIGTISSKDLNKYLYENIGINNKCNSFNKKVPRFVLGFDKPDLRILLNALVEGDGSEAELKDNDQISYRYATSSKQLADDVQELAFKCGYSAFISVYQKPGKDTKEYTVRWSDSNRGKNPIVYGNPDQYGAKINETDYSGQVWCFTVPTGLFVTRRNNRISIHGNSKFSQADGMINPLTLVKIGGGAGDYKPTPQDLELWRQVFEEAQYDKDFKIFTHEAVAVERVGYNQGIVDISPDITQLIKEIYIGLMVPPVLMDGGGEVTYANGSVTLDVLRQRYMQFRNMLALWLRRKIFAPISKINDFYEYKDGEKVLIVPDIDWNHMSLFDMGDYIQNLVNLTGPESKRISLQTLYRSLGLDWEDEKRKIKQEIIHEAIIEKEKGALGTMSLNDLRALGPNDEIQESAESPLPGEQPTPGESSGDATGGIPAPPGMPPPPAPTV